MYITPRAEQVKIKRGKKEEEALCLILSWPWKEELELQFHPASRRDARAALISR